MVGHGKFLLLLSAHDERATSMKASMAQAIRVQRMGDLLSMLYRVVSCGVCTTSQP